MLQPLRIKPGVNTQFTQSALGLGWAFSNLIRFRDGLLQKLGGWSKAVQTAFQGVCRGLHSWTQINGVQNMGIGTHLKLILMQFGQFFDLTPVRASGTLVNNPFTTVNTSNVVTVNSSGHGLSINDFVELAGAATFNNVTMNGEFQVQSIVDANNYTILASTVANASGVGGGAAVTFQYLLPVGLVDTTVVIGYGSGAYGGGPYGISSGGSFIVPARTWSVDNWGEWMIANPINLGIYYWQPSNGTSSRAVVVPNSPLFNHNVLVSSAVQQIISCGAETGGVLDPMLIRFSDVGDLTAWTANATNQAGSFRLSRGSLIIGALGSNLTNLIWTNEGLWLMQYQGLPFVYSFVQVGFGCGLIAPKAACSTPAGIFWMEESANFFRYNGTVEPLECLVRDKLAGNINSLQANKIFTGSNSQFNEVFWFYPSLNSNEVDSYVKYNYAENVWDYGPMPRTAWEDHENFPYPMATDNNSFIYNHETGVDADGMPMDSWAQTGYLMDQDGEYFLFIERLVPDNATFTGSLQSSIFAVDYPNSDTPFQFGPQNIVAGVTPFAIHRARGRGLSIKLESNVVGGNFRIGLNRVRASRAGKR